MVEWQTKVLASYIVSVGNADEKGAKTLFKSIEKLNMFSLEPEEEIEESTGEVKLKPEDDPNVYVEEGSQVAMERNSNGSFEKFFGRVQGIK